MKMVTLGQLVAPAQVRRAGSAEYPVLSMTMHAGLVAQTERFKKRIASLDTSDYKVVRRGQLVVGFPINEGVLDFQLLHDEAVVSPAYGIWDLQDDATVDRRYLKRYLKSPRAIAYYVGKMKGSTARRRSLPAAEFNAMPIPLPSLDEQRRIAAILDQADAIRAKRRQVLAHLDSLTQSIFHDMFAGTLESVRLQEVATTTSGGTPDRAIPENYGGTIPWVKSGELHSSVVVTTEEHITEHGLATSSAKMLPPDTVLLAMYGATAGVVARLGVSAATNQAICAISAGPRVNVDYLLAALRRMAPELLAKRSGGAQPNLSQAIIRDLVIPLPPLDTQTEFAARVSRINTITAQTVRAQDGDDELSASLQSRAFRGEL